MARSRRHEFAFPLPVASDEEFRDMDNAELRRGMERKQPFPVNVKKVPIKSLVGTQDATGWGDEPASTKGPISVTKYQGRHYIQDGHHRVAKALKRGQTHIKADILDLDE